MYNVRIFKYPSGWQVRTYSRPAGFFDPGESPDPETYLADVLAYDEDARDFVDVVIDSRKQCIEPFTFQVCDILQEPGEPDRERSARCSMNRTVNRVYHLSRSNLWDWFVTLTFDPGKVDSFDYDNCVKKLSVWLSNLRRASPDLRYIMVPEKHKSGRFHFHGLFACCEGLGFVESGHHAGNGQPIYNLGSYRLGWSTATRVRDSEKVARYISKYITKDLCSVSPGRKRYWASRNLAECETEEYLVEGTELSSYMEGLKSICKWFKSVECTGITTTYFEMEAGYGDG